MKKKAVVAGHICLDITPIFPGSTKGRTEDILLPGKLIHMDGVDIHIGGAVSNTGIAMKILGADVTAVGKVGNDDFGKLVLEELGEYGMEDHMIVSAESRTSYSMVLAIPGTDRIFLHDSGANDSFASDDIDNGLLDGADVFHFGYPPIMAKMYENEGEELVALLRKVKESGVPVSMDMAAVDPASEAGRVDWEKILEKALPLVDFFVPSVEELCYMLDRKMYREWEQRAAGKDITGVITWDEVSGLGKRCVELGAGVVMVKCGAPGLYYRTSDGEKMQALCDRLGLSYEEWGGKEGFEESYVPDKVLSGTGAGDTSIAAFLVSVLNGESLCTAMSMAAATGASCVAAYDALGGLKSLDELKNKIDSGWKKQKLNKQL